VTTYWVSFIFMYQTVNFLPCLSLGLQLENDKLWLGSNCWAGQQILNQEVLMVHVCCIF